MTLLFPALFLIFFVPKCLPDNITQALRKAFRSTLNQELLIGAQGQGKNSFCRFLLRVKGRFWSDLDS